MLLASSLCSSSLAVPKGGVVVDVDLTFLWPVAVFIVLLVTLKPILFEPMLKLFEERERRIDGAKLAARKMDEASAAALSKYESEMASARSAGNSIREAQRAEGLKAEADIVGKVREATAARVTEGRRALEAEAAAVRASLEASSKELAGSIASRVLGREVS